MDLKNQMNKLEMHLKKLEEQINELQQKCNHPIQKAAFRRPQTSSFQVMIICDDCGKVVRYPTKDEENEFLGK
jgi:RNase P subunit RPR2|tara:strand:- start:618 stop:836 length:219 start_codon:yes stop_codon:yes gene_type:complete